MAVDGREAGAVLSAQGLIGGVAGQEGVVDGLALGVSADGAFHINSGLQFAVFSVKL